MGRGRGGHKGGRRHFSNPDELAAQREREEKAKAWRKQRGDLTDSDEDDDDDESGSGSGSEESSSEDDGKAKGVQGLIEVNNPNRAGKKVDKSILSAVPEGPPRAAAASGAQGPKEVDTQQLSRREREEVEKIRAKEHYAKLTAEGKTDQARADLARLAIIKQQREEASKKKDEEKRARDVAAKVAGAQKVAGTKSSVSSVTASAPSSSAGPSKASKRGGRK